MNAPSSYQQAILAFGATGSGNLVVKAGAGSGKTTTLVQLVKVLQGSHIALAFNKPIQLEMEARGLNARTFHSLCYSVVLRAYNLNKSDVQSDKVWKHIRENFTDEQVELYGPFVKRLVGLAKNAGVGVLVDDTPSVWGGLANHHDLKLERETAQWDHAIALAHDVLAWNNAARSIDFDDMLYRVVRDGIVLTQYDNVVVDEGQDTNAIQIAVIRKLLRKASAEAGAFGLAIKESRLFVFGDDSQAIYGFRGADSNALNNIISEFDATVLPLTVSYRCARNVVEYASQFGTIEAAPNAVAGEVKKLPIEDAIKVMGPKDLVLSRCTAPVVAAAYKLLKSGTPAFVMGRDIGQGLVHLVEKMKAKGIDALIEKLNEYTEREVKAAQDKGQDSKAESIKDKTDCILFLAENLPETARSVPELIRVIERLFPEKGNDQAVVLATIHRTKGLEADRVFWLNHDYVSKWAKKDWQVEQEINLCYVAATRAKKELVLIPQPKRAA
jgi:DNA helicase II / ATP-dependent DNA helicase PcrA